MMNDEGRDVGDPLQCWLSWGGKWRNQTSIQFLCGEGVLSVFPRARLTQLLRPRPRLDTNYEIVTSIRHL